MLNNPNSLSFLNGLVNSIPDPVFVKDINHRFILLNDAICKFLNQNREDLLGKSDYDFFNKSEADIFREKDKQVFQTEKEIINEETLTNSNGKTFTISTKKNIFKDEEGTKYLVGIIRDITEKKAYENRLQELLEDKSKELKRQHQYLHYIINVIPNIIGTKDKNGVYTLANKALADLYGTDISSLLGKKDIDFNPNLEQVEFCIKTDQEVFKFGKPLQLDREKLSNARTKEDLWFQTYKIPLYGDNQAVNEVVFVGTDISQIIHHEQIIENKIKELNEKNKVLETYIESNLQLENFAYVASHDLREPIRTIVSFSQLLKKRIENKVNAEEAEFLGFIISATRNMQLLIDDLLTFSRVNTEKYHLETISPVGLFENILFNLKSQIDEKNAIINFHNIPESIEADSTRFVQLFQNLISNGIKFQKSDQTPLINVSCEAQSKQWVFKVQDNGIGIEPDYYNKIFILFRKLHSRELFQGSGIGLAVCKKIVEQHGGSIQLDSTLNKGTTFTIKLNKNLKVKVLQED